jgi:hypothetical protein
MLADLEALGMAARDLEPLFNSAEGYVKMWERATRRDPIPCVVLSDPSKWFTVTADGRLTERRWEQALNRWEWSDHGVPPGTYVVGSPGALLDAEREFFVTAADGRLFERRWDPALNHWEWSDHGVPPGTYVVGSPGALLQAERKFFVTAADGRLFERALGSGTEPLGMERSRCSAGNVCRRFKSAGHAQRFVEVHGIIGSHFRPRRHLLSADYRRLRSKRFQIWNEVTGATALA